MTPAFGILKADVGLAEGIRGLNRARNGMAHLPMRLFLDDEIERRLFAHIGSPLVERIEEVSPREQLWWASGRVRAAFMVVHDELLRLADGFREGRPEV
jgi:hypothetical protein